MKLRFVLAGAAAAAMLAAQPVTASGTLSANSLPTAETSIVTATTLADANKARSARKGSRLGDSEGAVPAFFLSPLGIIGTLAFTAFVFDAFNIIDLGLINKHIGPYGSVTA